MPRIPLWRAAFLLSGTAMMMGGPRHPSPHTDLPFRESLGHMLANPEWTPSHLLILSSFLLLFLGLALWRGRTELSGSAAGWARFALVAAGVACVEMTVHAAAVLDLERLRAGAATPILTTHLWLTLVANPLLGVALGGLALHGARLGRLGSWWIAWMAVLGGLAFGAAGVYVILTHDQRVSPLFAIGSSLLAFWMMFTALWPLRAPAPARVEALQPVGT